MDVRLVRALSAAVAVSAAVAACGDGGGASPPRSPPRATPRATVDAYMAAERSADGVRMCSLYSNRYRDLVANDPDNRPRLPCAELASRAARRAGGERNRVLRVEVTGDRAVATVSCADPTASDCSLPLVKEGSRWRVDGSLSPND